jgi:hypothetical protein
MHVIINAEREIRNIYFPKRPEIELTSRYYPRVQRVIIQAVNLYDLNETYTFCQDLFTQEIKRF